MQRSMEHLTTSTVDVIFLVWCSETHVKTQTGTNNNHTTYTQQSVSGWIISLMLWLLFVPFILTSNVKLCWALVVYWNF